MKEYEGAVSIPFLVVLKTQGIIKEKYLAKKSLNNKPHREVDHVLLHISGEHMLDLKLCFWKDVQPLEPKNTGK